MRLFPIFTISCNYVEYEPVYLTLKASDFNISNIEKYAILYQIIHSTEGYKIRYQFNTPSSNYYIGLVVGNRFYVPNYNKEVLNVYELKSNLMLGDYSEAVPKLKHNLCWYDDTTNNFVFDLRYSTLPTKLLFTLMDARLPNDKNWSNNYVFKLMWDPTPQKLVFISPSHTMFGFVMAKQVDISKVRYFTKAAGTPGIDGKEYN